MRIAVDVRSLSEPITGIGSYTLYMLQLMVKNSSNARCHLERGPDRSSQAVMPQGS